MVSTLFIILYLLRVKNKNLRDETNYDWSKFLITSIQNIKIKKLDSRDRTKVRVKDLSKGTGFIKEEHKFNKTNDTTYASKHHISQPNYLNYEEADNLQDMINFAASINQKDQKNVNIFPIESLYHQALTDKSLDKGVAKYTNDKLDKSIANCLQSTTLNENAKINTILELYAHLLRMKNKNLSAPTYIGLVELFIKNGYLNHASYFLCQMDRLKMNIPRSLLDLFLDYSISNGLFEKNKEKEEIKMNNNQYELDILNNKIESGTYNKYDTYEPRSEPEYDYYFSRKNNYKRRNDMQEVFSNLKLDAKPFYPKKNDDKEVDLLKQKLYEIDQNNIKEYVPKKKKVEQ